MISYLINIVMHNINPVNYLSNVRRCGHSHGSMPDDTNMLSCDVGVDCWNYTPVSMEQLQVHMSKKTFKPVDHHGDRD